MTAGTLWHYVIVVVFSWDVGMQLNMTFETIETML